MRSVVLCVALLAVMCRGVYAADESAKSASLIDGVAAYVNESVITIAEVMSEVRHVFIDDLPEAERDNARRSLYYDTLDAMINRRLIIDAAKSAGAQVAPWAVDQRVQEVINRQFGGDRAKLTAALTKQLFTFEEWRKIIEEDLIMQLMRYNNVEKHLVVSGQAVRSYYEANPQLFTQESGVGVSMIIIIADDNATIEAKGKKALQELEAGSSFADVAIRYSTDNKAKNGGSWGEVNPEEKFRKELIEALAKLKAGEHSPLLVLEDVGYIIKKDSEAKVEALTLTQAWPKVEARLKALEGEKKYVEWVNRLRKKAYIKIYELPMG